MLRKSAEDPSTKTDTIIPKETSTSKIIKSVHVSPLCLTAYPCQHSVEIEYTNGGKKKRGEMGCDIWLEYKDFIDKEQFKHFSIYANYFKPGQLSWRKSMKLAHKTDSKKSSANPLEKPSVKDKKMQLDKREPTEKPVSAIFGECFQTHPCMHSLTLKYKDGSYQYLGFIDISKIYESYRDLLDKDDINLLNKHFERSKLPLTSIAEEETKRSLISSEREITSMDEIDESQIFTFEEAQVKPRP
jgi:hypothetical protein